MAHSALSMNYSIQFDSRNYFIIIWHAEHIAQLSIHGALGTKPNAEDNKNDMEVQRPDCVCPP